MANIPGRPQKNRRLLFLSHETLPFVRQDEEILKKHFDLKSFYLKYYSTVPTALLTYAKVLIWLLKNIRQCDGLVLRFADVYGFFFSIFARLFGKKLFVIVGGFDATWIPELNYGTYGNKRSRFFTRFTLQTANRLFPVSESLVRDRGKVLGLKIKKQGIKTLYPEIDSKKIVVIPNGYRASHFKVNGQTTRAEEVILVGSIMNFQTFKIKGADTFIQLAANVPEYKFTLVGADPERVGQWVNLPDNLAILPYVPNHALPAHYQKAKVIMCLSRAEGMPNVLSEAMLCECVPVGLNISSIPEIIGDTGVVVDSMNMDEIKAGLRKAMKMEGHKARARIMDKYPLEAREKKLTEIIEAELSNTEPQECLQETPH